MRLGANHYVTKAWEPGILEAVIRVALKGGEKSGWGKPSASRFRNVILFHVNEQNPPSCWLHRS